MDPKGKNDIARVAGMMKGARSLFFMTGAGISKASGLPTCRGVAGIYNGQVPDDGVTIEKELSGEMMRERPEVTWKYLSRIEEKCRGAIFNRAHGIISEMEGHFERVVVLTQNIDGFHHDAGSKEVIDIYGDVHDLFCTVCDWNTRVEDYSGLSFPPACPD